MNKLNDLVADLNSAKTSVKAARTALMVAIAHVKNVRAEIKFERSLTRNVRADAAKQRKLNAAKKRDARVAALKARLEALEAKTLKAKGPKAVRKAAKKPSKVTYISKDAVAA
jgi:hypothetical protein